MSQGTIAIRAMDAREARACVETINRHINGARTELLDLYEREGWKALGYSSWRECAVAEFEQSQAYLYRQLQAAEVERNVSPMGEIGAIPERVLRPLAALPKEDQPTAWARAVETSGGRPTGRHVEAAARELRPSEPDPIVEEDDGWIDESPQEPAPRPEPSKMAVHFSSETPEHYTPPEIISATLAVLGSIDLDPCSNSREKPNVPAAMCFTAADDGLKHEWRGRVYMNPPYGRGIVDWISKL